MGGVTTWCAPVGHGIGAVSHMRQCGMAIHVVVSHPRADDFAGVVDQLDLMGVPVKHQFGHVLVLV